MSNYINLMPVILVILGAIVSIAAEPFIKDENKHKVLPWSAAFFVALAMVSCALLSPDTLFNLFAMDPVRRLLTGAVLFCSLLGISGIQWTLGHEKHKGGEPYGLMLLATGGALLMIQAIDYLALFIAMELTSFPVYALVGLRRRNTNSAEGVFKYFVSGAIFSAIFLYGVAMIYGATGTTSFYSSCILWREPLYAIGVLMVLFGVLFKAGAAPVHYWVADVYTGAAVAVTGFMAAVVKVAALAALGSIWLSVLVTKASSAPAWNLAEPVTIDSQSESLGVMVMIVAILSIAIGAFGGLAQKSIRRILAFSAVMNAGFILIGLLLPDYLVSGRVQFGPMFYFLITYAVASAGALTGVAYLAGKDDKNETLDDLQGAGRRRPFVSLAVAVCLASLAGLPPVAGFLA
ncbi:MAG: NADH-quinone oxidoreductase subunit N, partial [Fibrobacter sp.]|nr:NADH-quinone oxidoreductase subunit N [Fibrobacter sp.]